MNALKEEYAAGAVARSCKGARAGRAMLRLEKKADFEGHTVVLFGTGDTHGRVYGTRVTRTVVCRFGLLLQGWHGRALWHG